jgi:uncharacterized protein (DUF2237 family)
MRTNGRYTTKTDPLTGFYRTGCCGTGPDDLGVHVVCAQVTAEFLAFSRTRGNGLSMPRLEYGIHETWLPEAVQRKGRP